MEQKIIVISAMHHRQKTVKFCIDKMPFIEKYMIYSDKSDHTFLTFYTDVAGCEQVINRPLSYKWNRAIRYLKNIEFDAVIVLGSDDYIDENFVDFIKNNIENYDLISFKDIYFKENDDFFYWPGYIGQRKGEPAGAGKTYSKKFLEVIDYNLFPLSKNSSLDGMSWKVCKDANAKTLVTSLKDENIFLCDVKDGEGITKLSSITNITKL
ncbi:MAG: hypothetical protein JKY43_10170 [Phycisphaerales bacterium]|nr:hypothetical protein [Phycisphaerales bacterium]